MFACIAGDIVDNTQTDLAKVHLLLKSVAEEYALDNYFGIFRGDGFQLICRDTDNALKCALIIKARLRAEQDANARMSIGLGAIQNLQDNIATSTGDALTRAGRALDQLKQINQNLFITSDHPLDAYMNTCLKLAATYMDKWLKNSAEITYLQLVQPGKTQHELGEILGIKQSTASRRASRAYFDETLRLLDLYKRYINDITT